MSAGTLKSENLCVIQMSELCLCPQCKKAGVCHNFWTGRLWNMSRRCTLSSCYEVSRWVSDPVAIWALLIDQSSCGKTAVCCIQAWSWYAPLATDDYTRPEQPTNIQTNDWQNSHKVLQSWSGGSNMDCSQESVLHGLTMNSCLAEWHTAQPHCFANPSRWHTMSWPAQLCMILPSRAAIFADMASWAQKNSLRQSRNLRQPSLIAAAIAIKDMGIVAWCRRPWDLLFILLAK